MLVRVRTDPSSPSWLNNHAATIMDFASGFAVHVPRPSLADMQNCSRWEGSADMEIWLEVLPSCAQKAGIALIYCLGPLGEPRHATIKLCEYASASVVRHEFAHAAGFERSVLQARLPFEPVANTSTWWLKGEHCVVQSGCGKGLLMHGHHFHPLQAGEELSDLMQGGSEITPLTQAVFNDLGFWTPRLGMGLALAPKQSQKSPPVGCVPLGCVLDCQSQVSDCETLRHCLKECGVHGSDIPSCSSMTRTLVVATSVVWLFALFICVAVVVRCVRQRTQRARDQGRQMVTLGDILYRV